MVFTLQIKPAAVLQPFISCYALRVFNTGGIALPRPMHAVHEYYMTFFLKDQFCDIVNAEGNRTRKCSNSLTTIFTKNNGCGYWQGDYKVFCVQFKSNGLFAIFGIPQRLMMDAIYPLEDLLADDSKLLTEKFAGCADVHQMSDIMNSYLIKKLLSQKHKSHTITMAMVSNEILKYKGRIIIDRLSEVANMSFRNFERRFIDEIGMPPKLYARITRFYYAVMNKMLHPEKSWTDITYENGYYDQAHFIKEVKMFSAKSPEEFFSTTPPPKEKFTEMLES